MVFQKLIYINIIEIFLENVESGNKIFYFLSIINKLYLLDLMILLFICFVLGEKKNFTKKNIVINLQDLLMMLNSKYLWMRKYLK